MRLLVQSLVSSRGGLSRAKFTQTETWEMGLRQYKSQFPLQHGTCQLSLRDLPSVSIYFFKHLRLADGGPTAIPGHFGTQVQHHEWKIYTVISPLVTCVHAVYPALEFITKFVPPGKRARFVPFPTPAALTRSANEWHPLPRLGGVCSPQHLENEFRNRVFSPRLRSAEKARKTPRLRMNGLRLTSKLR